MDYPPCRLADWTDVNLWAKQVAREIHRRDRTPDTIVALTRGGWVPARLLSDWLGVRRLVSLRAQHWGVTAMVSGRAELTEGLSGSIEDQSVLVVDDITDTGESLALAMNHVQQQRPRRAESATLLHITHSRYSPTYYAEEIPREKWTWIIFPWNYWEDIRFLVERAGRDFPTVEGIQKALRQRCHLTVDLVHIRAVRSSSIPSLPERRRTSPSARAPSPPRKKKT